MAIGKGTLQQNIFNPSSPTDARHIPNQSVRLLVQGSVSSTGDFFFPTRGYAPDFITGSNEITAVHKPRFDTKETRI